MRIYRNVNLFLIILFVALLYVLSGGCLSEEAKCKRDFQSRYRIELPPDAKLVFVSSTYGAMCEGDDYFVWQFENEPTEILNSIGCYTNEFATGTEEEKSEIKENLIYRANLILESLSSSKKAVPEEYLPDWDSNLLIGGSIFRDVKNDSNKHMNLSHGGKTYLYEDNSKLMIVIARFF